MRIKLILAALLFLLPSIVCGSKEDKKSNIKTEILPDTDVSDREDIEHDEKISGPAVKTVDTRGHYVQFWTKKKILRPFSGEPLVHF